MKRLFAVLTSVTLVICLLGMMARLGTSAATGSEISRVYEGAQDYLSKTNAVLVDNTDNSQAAGGDHGAVVVRPKLSNVTVRIGQNTDGRDIINPVSDSKSSNFSNAAVTSPNGWGYSCGYGEPPRPLILGGTLVLQRNLAGLELHFYVSGGIDTDLNGDEVTLSVSDKPDGIFREVDVTRKSNPDWSGNYKAYIYSVADLSELMPSDRYAKFEFKKPDSAGSRARYEVQLERFVYSTLESELYTEVDLENREISTIFTSPIGGSIIKFFDNSTAVSPKRHGIVAPPGSSVVMGGVFTTNVPALDFDIRNVRFHVSYHSKHAAEYTGNEVTLSVAAKADGPFIPVDVSKVSDPAGAANYLSFIYSFDDPAGIPAGIRYVKFEFAQSDATQKDYENQLSHIDFGKAINEDNSASGRFVYRLTNMTDFQAQFNFAPGTENEPDIKFFVADTNRADAFREVEVKRSAGTVQGAPQPEDWNAFVYSLKDPSVLPYKAHYLMIDVKQHAEDTYDACQLMAVGHTYDNANTIIYDIRNKKGPNPVRGEGLISVTNPYPEAVGGTYAYQLYGATEGYLVFAASGIRNFRVGLSFSSAARRDESDYHFYVAPRDMDDEYVEIEGAFEKGLPTTGWSNYFFTPYDYNDIPAGSNYIKITTNTGGFVMVYMEADQSEQAGDFQMSKTVDLSGDDIIADNMVLNAQGALALDNSAQAGSLIIPAANHSWFKSTVLAGSMNEIGVTYFSSQSAEGPWAAVETGRIPSKNQPEDGVSFNDAMSRRNTTDHKDNFIKVVFAASCTAQFSGLSIHQDMPRQMMPDYIACPAGWRELRDYMSSDGITIENGGKALEQEMLAFETVGYGYGGDTMRAICRQNPDTDAFVVYQTEESIRYFDARALKLTQYSDTNFDFYVSADGEDWEYIEADDVELRTVKYEGGREQTSYVCDKIPKGMTYLRVEFPILASTRVTELSLVGLQILYSNAGYSNDLTQNQDTQAQDIESPPTGAEWKLFPAITVLLTLPALLCARRKRTKREGL